jgi:hypothetical protein
LKFFFTDKMVGRPLVITTITMHGKLYHNMVTTTITMVTTTITILYSIALFAEIDSSTLKDLHNSKTKTLYVV